jgi:hypothetical protein
MAADTNHAARRRASWAAGVAAAQELRTMDDAYWRRASVSDKLDALRVMAEELATMEGHGASSRLQRHLGGVRRQRG